MSEVEIIRSTVEDGRRSITVAIITIFVLSIASIPYFGKILLLLGI